MTTDNQEYVFVPSGDKPTVQNLKTSLFKMIGFIAVCSAIATYFLKPSQEIDALYAFVALSTLMAIIIIPARYIQNIRIDPGTRKLYATYLKMNGENGTIIFDLDVARVNYIFKSSRASGYWLLTLKEGKSKIRLSQSSILSTRDQKNSFPKAQLDKINELINQIKNNVSDQL